MDERLKTLADLPALGAEAFGDQPAYRPSGRLAPPVTYRQVYDSARGIAAFLREHGVRPGDSVGIYAPNMHEWAVAFWGIVLAGGVVVPVDYHNGPAEIAHVFAETGARWAFTTRRLVANLARLGLEGTIILDAGEADGGLRFRDVQAHRPGDEPVCAPEPTEPAVIISTSGTGNRSVGVVLTHRSILAGLPCVLSGLAITGADRFLSVIHLSHTFEITCGLVLPFMTGASVAYARDIKYTTVFRCMEEVRPTVVLGVPSMFRMLLENAVQRVTGERALSLAELESDRAVRAAHAEQVRQCFGGSVRHLVSGGAPLAASVSLAYRDVGIGLLQVYGLTETSGVCAFTPPAGCAPGSVGRALECARLRIESPDARGIGEICVAGDQLMAGYHNDPAATGAAVRDGWLHTGDLGRLDEDGFLFITGRSKDVIITGAGVNVSPEELEERIIRSPYISEVCVVGREKPDRTETVFAVVVPDLERVEAHAREEREAGRGAPALQELIRREIGRCTAGLARFKRVQDMQIRTHPLPRGADGRFVREAVKRESFSILGRMGVVAQPAPDAPPLVLTNATAITPFRVAHKSCIVIEGEKITQFGDFDSVYLPPNAEVVDLQGQYVVPGFVDLHVHGGGGHAFNTADEAGVEAILDYFISHGTTRLLATIQADERHRFLGAIEQVADFCRRGVRHGVLHGIHVEGPFVNKDMAGALNPDYLWDATIDNQLRLQEAGRGHIKMMTMAPEVPGAHDVMQVASQAGIVLAVAHSRASYEDVNGAIDLGLSQVTHIFNAMPPIHHRTPGVLTAAFLRRELKVHLIADGIHVHPAIVTLLHRLKGESGIILISDAVTPSGCEDGTYEFSDQEVTVRRGRAYLRDGTLAGSTVTLDRSVKFLVENTDIPIQEAVRMATLNPARALALDRQKGVIAVGRDADLVVLDKGLEVDTVLIGGRAVYRRPEGTALRPPGMPAGS